MTLTKFFGVSPKSVENCRVLELGCGTGSSMLSFAYDLPGSEFIGIDLSEKQIEVGNIPVKAIGLENMKLIQGDIMQINHIVKHSVNLITSSRTAFIPRCLSLSAIRF